MAKNETVPQINEVSRIASGTDIKGNLVSQSDIRIDGSFEGDLITSGKLVLGDTAIIKGNIICSSADVWGRVDGELIVGDSVTFKANSNFFGNLKTVRICIEMGAVFNGTCRIITEDEYRDCLSESNNPR